MHFYMYLAVSCSPFLHVHVIPVGSEIVFVSPSLSVTSPTSEGFCISPGAPLIPEFHHKSAPGFSIPTLVPAPSWKDGQVLGESAAGAADMVMARDNSDRTSVELTRLRYPPAFPPTTNVNDRPFASGGAPPPAPFPPFYVSAKVKPANGGRNELPSSGGAQIFRVHVPGTVRHAETPQGSPLVEVRMELPSPALR
jgi:hypothetical protein